MTNESEAMEIARRICETSSLLTCDGGYECDEDQISSIIATALEAKDARIRELEGALEQIQLMVEDEAYKVTAGQEPCKHTAALNAVHEVVAAILTKEKTHD